MAIVYRNVKGSKLTIADMDGNFSHLVSEISAETSRATSAENTLTNNLNSEISTRAADDATLTSNLNSEISRATNAELNLQNSLTNDLNAEISRATTAEAANANAITAEISTARAAEAGLAGDIAAEISRATTAEASNANALTAEITRATNAENVNAAAIDALPDSAQVLGLIDSSHVALKAIGLDYGVLANKPTIPVSGTDFVDSAFVTAQIDALIDGAPGTLDTLNEIAAALNDDDSAYNTLIGLIAAKTDFDSADTIQLIDSAYIQAKQSGAGGEPNQNAFGQIAVAGQNQVNADDPNDAITFTAGSNMTITTDAATDTITFSATAGGVDSAYVTTTIIGQVDAGYVQARAPASYIQSKIDVSYIQNAIDSDFVLSKTGTILDSALTTQLIDSAYVQLRQTSQDFAYSSLTGAPTFISSFNNDLGYLTSALDSAEAIALIDSAYVQVRQAPETITLAELKTEVAASTDFADFKTRIAAL
jgi:hypothetical protein